MKNVCLLLTLIFMPYFLHAECCVWLGGTGNWSDPTKWEGGIVPGLGESAYINSGTVTLDISPTVSGLYLWGGNIDGTGNLTVTGGMTWGNSSTISGNGSISVAGFTSIADGPKSLSGRSLILSGNTTWTATTAGISITNGGSIEKTGGTLSFVSNGSATISGGILTLGSTVNKLGSGSILFDGETLNVTGSLVLSSGAMQVSSQNASFTGANITGTNGTLGLTGGTHSFSNTTIARVPIQISTGASASFTGCTFSGVNSTISASPGAITYFSGNTLAPASGSTAIMNLNGFPLDLNGNTFNLGIKSLSGPYAGGNDLLALDNSGVLGGTLNIALLSFTPVVGDNFLIMSCDGGCTGSFGTITSPSVAPNVWEIDMSIPNEVHLVLAAPLPLELTDFQAIVDGMAVRLTWHTANEVGLSQFIIERSGDGKRWESMGKLPATNDEAVTGYAFTDPTPRPGINYYRLRIVNLDGSTEYTPIRAVESEIGLPYIHAYPNPTAGMFRVSFGDKRPRAFTVTIHDVLGRLVSAETFEGMDEKERWIDLTGLPVGVYTIRATESGDRVSVARVSKQ